MGSRSIVSMGKYIKQHKIPWELRSAECVAAIGAAAPGKRVETVLELSRDLLVSGFPFGDQDDVKAGQTKDRDGQDADQRHKAE